MRTIKVAVTIDQNLLKRLDRLVAARLFPSRSRAVQEAIRDKLQRLDQNRLARECAKLDPVYEQALAEEGINDEWPAY